MSLENFKKDVNKESTITKRDSEIITAKAPKDKGKMILSTDELIKEGKIEKSVEAPSLKLMKYTKILKYAFGDVNGDGINDAVFAINQDTAPFKNNNPAVILGNAEKGMGIVANCAFMDGYKFSVTYKLINFRYIIDVSDKKEMYKDLYSEGKLKGSVQYGGVEGFYELVPNDTDNDSVPELLGAQYIAGYSRADSVGALRSIQKWDK